MSGSFLNKNPTLFYIVDDNISISGSSFFLEGDDNGTVRLRDILILLLKSADKPVTDCNQMCPGLFGRESVVGPFVDQID